MEFILSTDLATAIPQEIDFNYDELKTQLSESLDRYNSLVVTEDAIQPAKKDRAALNKLKTAIEDKRKDVKKACLLPYEAFESKAKELTGMIQRPINAIDNQIKAFEEQKRQDKHAAIEHFYSDNIKELRDLLPLEKILPAKWANAGVPLMEITQEIMSSINKTRSEFGIIQKMGLSFESQIVDVYLRTLDMGAALAEKSRLEEQAKALEQAKRQRESEKSAAVDAKPVAAYIPSPVSPVACVPTEPEELQVIDFRVWVTPEQKQLLRQFMLENNIKYGGVPNGQ